MSNGELKLSTGYNITPGIDDLKLSTGYNIRPGIDDLKLSTGYNIGEQTKYVRRSVIPIKDLFMTAPETRARKALTEKYGRFGFKFLEDVDGHKWGQDWLRVYAPDGTTYIDVGFDYKKGSVKGGKHADRLEEFLNEYGDFKGEDMWMVETPDEELFHYQGLRYTESEMFDKFRKKKLSTSERGKVGNYEKIYDRWDVLMYKRDYEEGGINNKEEKELQNINKVLDDFEGWVLGLTKETNWRGKERSGVMPHTRMMHERSQEKIGESEESLVDEIRKDLFGSSIEAWETGFLHDEIEVQHRNYKDGQRQTVRLESIWGGDRSGDVNTLYQLYLAANPNIGLFADHRKNRALQLGAPQWDEETKTYIQGGIERDKDKIQELLKLTDDSGKQLYSLKEAEDIALVTTNDRNKRQSVTNSLFVEKDEDEARFRNADKTTLKDSGWEVKKPALGVVELYHNGKLVTTELFDFRTSLFGQENPAHVAYNKLAQYIYKHASNDEIGIMYTNQQEAYTNVLKQINTKKESIKISDTDAFDSYIDSGAALDRFKQELTVNDVSKQAIEIIENYINASDSTIENRSKWIKRLSVMPGIPTGDIEQMLGFDLTEEALSYVLGDQLREDKVRKFQNLGAIWNLIPEKDKNKIIEVLEKRKGYIDVNGNQVASTFERGIEMAKFELMSHKNRIYSEQIFEKLEPEQAELVRRYSDFRKIEASQQSAIIENYSNSVWKHFDFQYKDKAEILQGIIERGIDDGVSIVFTNNDITQGFEIKTNDKELKDKYYSQLVKVQGSIKELDKAMNQAEVDITGKISVWQNDFKGVFNLDGIANIDYDTWWEDFGYSWTKIGLSVPALFGSDAAKDATQRIHNAKMNHGETVLSWQEAIETKQKWEYVANTGAEQLPNIILAFTPIGRVAGKVLGKVGVNVTKNMQRKLNIWAVPTVYGITSAGSKRMLIEGRQESALKAREALLDLNTAYDNKNISYNDYVDKKVQLERIIAEGDIDGFQKWGSILTTGTIEAVITRFLGTAPNARALMKGLYNKKTTDLAELLFRSNRKAISNAVGQTIWRTGGEILEETTIEVGNVLGDALWLGDDMDWSNVDDVMVQSLIMGGGMNAPGVAYTTITQQMATSEFRKEGLSVIETLKRIENQWKNPNLSETSRKELISQYAVVLDQFNSLKDGLEIDAMLVGAENIKKLMGLNTELGLLYDKAKIEKGDTQTEIDEKLEQYKKGLEGGENGIEANNFQNSIDNINSAKQRVYDGIDYSGKIKKLFGRPGEQLDARWKDKNNTSKKAVEYRNADAKGRLKMILQQIRTNITNNNIRKAKADPRWQEKIEEEVYSERDKDGKITKKMNFEQWKKATGKKNRKTKIENAIWANIGGTMLARNVDVKILFEEGDVNAAAVLGNKLASDLKIKVAKNIDELRKAVEESNLRDDQKNEILADLAIGKANAVIIDNQYIVLNEKMARMKLDNGDLMQGTVMSHEISHFLDDMAFTKKEIIDYSTKLHSYLSKNKELNHILLAAKRDLIESGVWEGGEDATFENQDYTVKDEFVRAVQSLLQADYNKGAYNAIKKNVGQSLMNKLRGLVKGDYKIKTDQDAMYYMMAFIENFSNGKGISKVAKRKIKAAKKKDKKVIAKDVKVKKSKAKQASEKVQRIYEEKGVEGSLEIIDQYTPMVSKLVEKYRNVPGFDKQLLMDEIKTGKRGILDLIMEYNLESGVPLAAYINKYLASRSIEAANRILKTQFETDIDTERGIAEQVEETTEEYSETVGVEQKQNLRKKLNIVEGDPIYNKIIESVVKTFGTRLPDITSKKFKQELTKAFRTELKKTIADLMGTRVKYEQFLKDNWQAIYESIPQTTMNKRFKDFIEPVLDKDGKQLREKTPQGNAIFTKKKINQGDFLNYFLSKTVGASTRGTRKDALAEELGVELAFDATMQVVQSPEIQEKRNQISSLLNQEQYDNEVAIIAKQIDRDPNVKFNKSSADAQFIELVGLVKKQGYGNIFNKNGDINTKYKNRFNERVLGNFNKLFDENKLLSIDSEVIRKRAEDLFKTKKFPDKGIALERAINDYVDSLNIPGLVVLEREVSEKDGLADLVLGINIGGESFIETNVEIKLSATQVFMSNRLVTNYNIKTGKFTYTDDIKSLRQGEMLNKTRPAIKAFYARANELIREHNKITLFAKIPEMEMATDYMPEYIYDKLIEEGLWNAVRKESLKHGEHDESLVVEMYGMKKYPSSYIELLGKGLYALGQDIMFNGKVPSLKAIIDVGIHMAKYSEAKKKDGTRTREQQYGVKMVQAKPRFQPKIRQGQQIDSSPVSLSNEQSLRNIMSDYSKLAEIIKSDYKDSKSRRESINNARPTSKYSKSRGMSTFDFDETLIIEGENFITATHPDTKETVKISSADWPKIGPRLANQNYEFDFSDFVNVRGGIEGPLLQKMRNQIKKFGSNNMFVLTARPKESAQAIHGWLKSQGINVPLKNITGLGDSTGEAKARWMLEKFAEGYNDMYFVDDALSNVDAVKDVLDQLDIKSKVVQAKSLNEVKDVDRLGSPGSYDNIKFSKSHKSEYEKTISKNRPDLVKEGLVSQTIEEMFKFVEGLNVPGSKKRKYEQITTKWLATSKVKLPEDAYKIKEAVELSEKHKEDIFSYRNPNKIIEKYAGKTKEKPTDPKTVKEFAKGTVTNKEYGITEYVVENTKEGQLAVRKVMDTHFGKNSNPWCLAYKGKDGKLTEDSWKNWQTYSGGPKSMVFQNGKLIGFKANEQYWDRMDNATSAPVVRIKEGRVTKKVELVPIGKGKIAHEIMEIRTVSKDKKTVTTEILVEQGYEGYRPGTKIVENRVKGQTVKEIEYLPETWEGGWIKIPKPGTIYRETNFKNGKPIETRTFNHKGKIHSINNGKNLDIPTQGDLIAHEITDGKVDLWFGEVLINGKVTEIGFKTPRGFEVMDIMKRVDGKLRVDLNKLVEIDPNIKGLPKEVVKPKGIGALKPVKKVLDKLDVKSEVVQARVKFSKSIADQFNSILEQATGINQSEKLSRAQAKLKGKGKGTFKFIIPPSAQDFMGLMYNLIGKGKEGDKQIEFLKKVLLNPFSRGIRELNKLKQTSWDDYSNLLKKFPGMKKKLRGKVPNTDFTVDQAVRVYLWNKAGFDIPGMSKKDIDTLDSFIKNNSELQAFSDGLGMLSKRKEGYSKPGEYWFMENIASDLFSDGSIGDVRSEILAEWIENKNIIFSEENLNKIEAAYGSNFREALEDVLYAMETGRSRPVGKNRITNKYMNWVNNSVGAIMFFNMRSALLQTISAFNYINWSDNNIAKAAATFANQPQFWKDFVTLFNSDMLKQRRRGQQRGVNENELMQAVVGSANPAKAAIAWLLNKGFLPTQIADSFAICSGGATFYRNRIKSLMKADPKMTLKQAEEQAFLDFQEATEVAQQSSRADLISQQQRSPLGRLVLAFANAPMQYARIMNKAARDLAAGRGDTKTHISKIIYYGAVQTFMFTALQQALWAAIGNEEEEEEIKGRWERVLNGMIDSVLVGIGFGGRAISTVKNSIMEYFKQRDKEWNADHAYTLLQLLSFSPPLQSKLRKIYAAIQTEKFNRDVIAERGFTLDNPLWDVVGNTVEGFTNLPLGRIHRKLYNLEQALNTNNELWQRIALVLGWNAWNIGVEDPDIQELKINIKQRKKEEKKIETKIKKEKKVKEEEEKEKILEEKNIKLQKQEKEDGKKEIKCAAISNSGERCSITIEPGSSYCTIHAKVEQSASGKKVQCRKMKQISKNKKERCKMQTSAKSGLCYYHD